MSFPVPFFFGFLLDASFDTLNRSTGTYILPLLRANLAQHGRPLEVKYLYFRLWRRHHSSSLRLGGFIHFRRFAKQHRYQSRKGKRCLWLSWQDEHDTPNGHYFFKLDDWGTIACCAATTCKGYWGSEAVFKERCQRWWGQCERAYVEELSLSDE